MLSRSSRCYTRLRPYPTTTLLPSSTLPRRFNSTHSHSHSHSHSGEGSSSSNSSNALLAMASALFFVPAFLYLTKPPETYLSHKVKHSLSSRQSSNSFPDPVSLDNTTPPTQSSNSFPDPVSLDNTTPPTRFKYVLIGGGTASYSAMLGIREIDPTGEILFITAENFPPYQRPPLTKELWFSDDPQVPQSLTFNNWEGKPTSLFYQDVTSYENITDATHLIPTGSGTKLITGTHAVDLDVDNQTITLSSGVVVQYEKVLLATGGTPRKLPYQNTLPEAVQRRVVTYRTLNDYQKLVKIADQGKHIAIIGGGFLGSELSVALAHKTKVTQVFPEEGNMALVFPKYLTRWTTQQIRDQGIEVMTKSTVTGLRYDDNTDQMIVELNGQPRHFDHVVVAVGIEPNVALAHKAGLEVDPIRGGVVVNAELEARHNVFCAGDNVSFHDIALGRRRVEHYDNAVLQGRWAGRSMAGQPKAFTHQSMFWSDIGPKIRYEAIGVLDSTLITVGVWGQDSTTVTGEPVGNKDKDKDGDSIENEPLVGKPSGNEEFRKGVVFYCRDNKIIGVLLFNLPGKIDVARHILLQDHQPSQAKALAAQIDIS